MVQMCQVRCRCLSFRSMDLNPSKAGYDRGSISYLDVPTFWSVPSPCTSIYIYIHYSILRNPGPDWDIPSITFFCGAPRGSRGPSFMPGVPWPSRPRPLGKWGRLKALGMGCPPLPALAVSQILTESFCWMPRSSTLKGTVGCPEVQR